VTHRDTCTHRHRQTDTDRKRGTYTTMALNPHSTHSIKENIVKLDQVIRITLHYPQQSNFTKSVTSQQQDVHID